MSDLVLRPWWWLLDQMADPTTEKSFQVGRVLFLLTHHGGQFPEPTYVMWNGRKDWDIDLSHRTGVTVWWEWWIFGVEYIRRYAHEIPEAEMNA